MKNALLALTAVAMAVPAAAQMPSFAKAERVGIVMTNHGFEPRRVDLTGGRPYVLSLVNRSDRAHNFSATAFLSDIRLAPRDAARISGRDIDLQPGERLTLRIVAPRNPGARYSFKSTKLTDAASDMDGNFFIH